MFDSEDSGLVRLLNPIDRVHEDGSDQEHREPQQRQVEGVEVVVVHVVGRV